MFTLLVYSAGRQAECGAEECEKQTLEVGDWGRCIAVGGPGLTCQSQPDHFPALKMKSDARVLRLVLIHFVALVP